MERILLRFNESEFDRELQDYVTVSKQLTPLLKELESDTSIKLTDKIIAELLTQSDPQTALNSVIDITEKQLDAAGLKSGAIRESSKSAVVDAFYRSLNEIKTAIWKYRLNFWNAYHWDGELKLREEFISELKEKNSVYVSTPESLKLKNAHEKYVEALKEFWDALPKRFKNINSAFVYEYNESFMPSGVKISNWDYDFIVKNYGNN